MVIFWHVLWPKSTPPPPAKLAFSLVELSIVLVILGLLVGGILSGQSLIRAAELRSVASDFSKYNAAMYTFRDKYFAIPGDMPNAVRFWGAAAGGTADGPDATCAALTTASTDGKTCNGNGDGQLSDFGYVYQAQEVYRSWQQLADAGLIEGQYSGVSINAYNMIPTPGQDAPRARISSAGYRFRFMGTYGDGNFWPSNYGHILDFALWPASMPALKPEEAWNIDTKLDDGNPAYGRIIAFRNSGTMSGISSCTTSDTQASTAYNLSYSSLACAIVYKLGF